MSRVKRVSLGEPRSRSTGSISGAIAAAQEVLRILHAMWGIEEVEFTFNETPVVINRNMTTGEVYQKWVDGRPSS